MQVCFECLNPPSVVRCRLGHWLPLEPFSVCRRESPRERKGGKGERAREGVETEKAGTSSQERELELGGGRERSRIAVRVQVLCRIQ